jgi:hypothetical protein
VQPRFRRGAQTPNILCHDRAPLRGASSTPTHASIRRAPRKIVWVSMRRPSAPATEKRSKRARDSHDTILNVISANRDRVIPDPPLAPNLSSGPR